MKPIWISSQDFPICSSATKFKSIVNIERNSREIYRTDHLHFDVQRHLIGIKRQQSRMRLKCSTRLSLPKEFGAGQWSYLGPGSQKKWYSISEDSPQGEWDKIEKKMMLTFAQSTLPVFLSTSPLSRGVLKRSGGELSIHYYCADQGTIETVFRTIFFCKSVQYLRSSRIRVWKMWHLSWQNRVDSLWEDNLVHRSCQVWLRQVCFRIVMTMFTKKILQQFE